MKSHHPLARIERRRARRISRAVRFGRAVEDPGDARLAVEWARYVRERLRRKPLSWYVFHFGLPVIVVSTMVTLIGAAWFGGLGGAVSGGAAAVMLVLAQSLSTRLWVRNAVRAEAANLRIVEGTPL